MDERLDRRVWIVAGAGVALLIAVSSRYGYHRDELYFLRAAQDLAWGYADQPPLTVLIARLVDELLAGWLPALRLLPALAFGGLVLITATIARDLGAGRTTQIVAALCTAGSGQFLGAHHLLSTTPFDWFFSAVVLLLFVRLVKTQSRFLWVPIGAVTGVALLNKWMIAFVVAALVVGLALSRERGLLTTPWILLGGGLALGLWAPNLYWQAQNSWPALEVARSISEGFRSEEGPLVYIGAQFLYAGPIAAPIWIAGLIWLWGNDQFRPLAIAYAFLLALFLLTGGKSYYVGAMYIPLFAAGAVALSERLTRNLRSWLVALVIGWAIAAVIALPVVPQRVLATVPIQEMNYDIAEQIGWPSFVEQVADAHSELPQSTAILTANYGEAGAIERYRHYEYLPEPYSGHNNYWLWGPPPDRYEGVLAIGFRDQSYLDRFFGECRSLGSIAMPHGIENDEQGARLVYCARLRHRWADLWPSLQRYG